MTALSPAYDNRIVRKYSARTVEHKVDNKLALQEALGWVQESKQPLLSIPSGITEKLGGDLLTELLPGLIELPIGIVVRGRGSKKYGEFLTTAARKNAHRIAILPDDEKNLRALLAGSDIALFLAQPDSQEDLENCLRYGTIPVAPEGGILENYNPVQESGNAFTYDNETVWQCFAAVVRAIETLKFPYDWRTIERHAMETMEKRESLQPA